MIEHCVRADDVTALGEDKGAIFQVRKFGFIFRFSLFSVGDCIYKAYDSEIGKTNKSRYRYL